MMVSLMYVAYKNRIGMCIGKLTWIQSNPKIIISLYALAV